MRTLLVPFLIVLSVVIAALTLRRSSGDASYRRRLTPRHDFRRPDEPAEDGSVLFWTPLLLPGSTHAHPADPGCTAAGHSGADCGSSAGADGGSS